MCGLQWPALATHALIDEVSRAFCTSRLRLQLLQGYASLCQYN